MEITKVIAIALVAIVMMAILKQYRPEFAIHISIITGTLIVYLVLKEFSPIMKLLQNLSAKMGVSSQFFLILLKITGIAYLTEFGASVCKDSGETAIASKVELAGKVLIIGLSIPIMTTLIETLLVLL